MPRYYDTDGNYTVFGLIGRELLGSELVCLAGVTGNIQDQLNSAGGVLIHQSRSAIDEFGDWVETSADPDHNVEVSMVHIALESNVDMLHTDPKKIAIPSDGFYEITVRVLLNSDAADSVGIVAVVVNCADIDNAFLKATPYLLKEERTMTEILSGNLFQGTVCANLEAGDLVSIASYVQLATALSATIIYDRIIVRKIA